MNVSLARDCSRVFHFDKGCPALPGRFHDSIADGYRAAYTYDALGRLAVKQTAPNGHLHTHLHYDLHGWLDQIVTVGGSTALFQEALHYALPTKPSVTPRYDGNPSETMFSHKVSGAGTDEHTWGYTYDRMNRLEGAMHFVGSSVTPSLADTEQGIAYDLNGNITALKRYGSSGLEYDLSFAHSGNRMTALTDALASGSAAGAKSFTYDANGNLTHDSRQDLDIRWNIFNLASGAETHDGGSLTLARLSDGTLFAQQKENGGNTTGKRYCGSFVFTTGTGNTTPQVECVAWDEGRIFADTAGNYRDCWFAGDHLGNVRSVLDITPDVTIPVPLEQNDYLPFGTKISNPLHAQMNTNRWRYAGKEEFPDLNLLDFGARMYDPFTARWTAVDPQGKKVPGFSTYAYCGDNPVFHKELDGEVWDTFIDAGFLAYDVGSAIYQGIKGNRDAAKASWKSAGADFVFAIVPGASVVMFKGAKALHRAGEIVRSESEAFKALSHAGEFGVDSYRTLRNAVTKTFGKNSGLEVHHLIEQRFSKALGLDPNKMPSVVLTKEEHKMFTKRWREVIGYDVVDKGRTTTTQATKEDIFEAAKKVYKDYPEILKVLGIQH